MSVVIAKRQAITKTNSSPGPRSYLKSPDPNIGALLEGALSAFENLVIVLDEELLLRNDGRTFWFCCTTRQHNVKKLISGFNYSATFLREALSSNKSAPPMCAGSSCLGLGKEKTN